MTTDVIETLCSIDDRADQIIENAAAQKKTLAREFDEKAQDMTKKVQAQARERMKALEMELDAENAEKLLSEWQQAISVTDWRGNPWKQQQKTNEGAAK